MAMVEISVEEIKASIELKLQTLFGRTFQNASKSQIYKALATTVSEYITKDWAYSKERVRKQNAKQVYYLSMEFLMGRFLENNLMNLEIREKVKKAFEELDADFDDIQSVEPDAGLGNGGLGRLAACFLDSMATMGLPGHGNGIRYEYGLFQQKIKDGQQVEMADPWLEYGNVWEVSKSDEPQLVHFGGELEYYHEGEQLKVRYLNCQCVKAIPYDVPILGYQSNLINTLRLWGARSLKPLDMGLFRKGQYVDALAEKELAEVISKMLYPEDIHEEGKHLRLKQQYFFVSASIQSIIKKYKNTGHHLMDFHKNVAIHINDTHPALAIPELMRILMDEEGLNWKQAWLISRKTFAYTNHTILPEAMETWSVELIQSLLPRIYDIIHEINERFSRELWELYPGDWDRIERMAVISHQRVHMAKLAILGSGSVNGVAELHGEILKKETFKDFYEVYPEIFKSITNGISHRRFLLLANEDLAREITERIGKSWVTQAEDLEKLEAYAKDEKFQKVLKEIRREKKKELADYILLHNEIEVDIDSIFDTQVKRFHEYKRQLMNVLHIMHLYNQILENPENGIHPRTFIFSGKAAPGYHRAKLIIKLIHSVAERVNNDKTIKGKIKVVFIENYNVTLAQKIIPASDVSKQISTAGKEASGTGNMKFMLNGAFTLGTFDGANIEMQQAVGKENMEIFGLREEEISKIRQEGSYRPDQIYEENPALRKVMDQLIDGTLEPEDPDIFREIYHDLLERDPYFILKDFEAYCRANEKIDELYQKPEIWWEKGIQNIAKAGYFSSDRTIKEYSEGVWDLKPVDPT
ncbi:glycogen/starch/alpha-glucan phosphorylase [Isachenkonia alkalipeptolytica]|uniref:Alpha-1,4 glucan phosphorylase n=2 Tax=Isachenkonia alkalipeptolytica TaxID=2565777 RepID=A0AA44BDX3_9CLOT|nr:glycogen/starch/alpha-glucan phosphorylase [Isachenkonia alkalipeptolytica]NBG86891.1 glycogen/starch/alpha-glucan phosphorylase [Isachenkonia alkalipeptolytica]